MLETNDDYEVTLLRFLAQWPGGQGEAGEICSAFLRQYRDQIPRDHYRELSRGGESWHKRLNFARLTLKHLGLLDAPERGVWRITQAGRDWVRNNSTATCLDGQGSGRRRGRRQGGKEPPPVPPGITLAMLEETRKLMSPEDFRRVWGAIYDQLLAQERAKAVTDIGQVEIGRRALQQLAKIHGLLRGKNPEAPAGEAVCDWIHFCYALDLIREAAALLTFVQENEVDPATYRRAKRVAETCRSRLGR